MATYCASKGQEPYTVRLPQDCHFVVAYLFPLVTGSAHKGPIIFQAAKKGLCLICIHS